MVAASSPPSGGDGGGVGGGGGIVPSWSSTSDESRLMQLLPLCEESPPLISLLIPLISLLQLISLLLADRPLLQLLLYVAVLPRLRPFRFLPTTIPAAAIDARRTPLPTSLRETRRLMICCVRVTRSVFFRSKAGPR